MGWYTISGVYFYILDFFEGTYTLRILQSFLVLLIKIAPYLVISILIQVMMMRLVMKKEMTFQFRKRMLATFLASILGILSPLPTYAALPIGLSFIPMGIPISAIMAFIIASPLINPSVFFLTMTQLGYEIAFARVVTAFVLSLSGGFISGMLFKSIKDVLYKNNVRHIEKSFLSELKRSLIFVGRHFAVALLISAIVKAMVSPQLVTEILGQHIQQSLLVAIALGIPFYSCGGAAIPFVDVLSELGMNKGAVLAFFIAGPATKLETLYIFKSLLGIKILLFYLVLTAVGAYIAGIIMLI
ncbi:MAG: permease [candidate division KSB1 bacterium]|jgi:uncharacterized membrane protein YraQ (UPF0718 family)|nr:permease [candidate division KSB1 bacterium]